MFVLAVPNGRLIADDKTALPIQLTTAIPADTTGKTIPPWFEPPDMRSTTTPLTKATKATSWIPIPDTRSTTTSRPKDKPTTKLNTKPVTSSPAITQTQEPKPDPKITTTQNRRPTFEPKRTTPILQPPNTRTTTDANKVDNDSSFPGPPNSRRTTLPRTTEPPRIMPKTTDSITGDFSKPTKRTKTPTLDKFETTTSIRRTPTTASTFDPKRGKSQGNQGNDVSSEASQVSDNGKLLGFRLIRMAPACILPLI